MKTSSYFSQSEDQKEEEQKKFIPPDYGPSEDDEDPDEDEIPDAESDEDEGAAETKLDECLQENNKDNKKEEKVDNMVTTPFGQPVNNTPSWGQSGNSGSSWGQSGGSQWGSSGSTWGSQKPSNGLWGSGSNGSTPWGGNQTQKEQINRDKKVIFIDFLDCIVETYQSNGQPGLLPRDIYDLKPRFDVWQKLAAFNPEKVYSIIPVNLIPNTNGIAGWQQTLGYFCCSLSAFLRVPYTSCQILAQSRVGQPKQDIMMSVIHNIPKEDIVSIGIYSGLYGQSNRDIVAANICGIDHLDLNQLLNNMY